MDKFNEQVAFVRKAYDKTVDLFDRGIDPSEMMPVEFYNSKKFKDFINNMGDHCSSNAPENRIFLEIKKDDKILDIGCCANLANYRLDRWGGIYYGMDISSKLIKSMKKFCQINKINFGGFEVGQMINMPYENKLFDSAMAIGVLEYFSFDYILLALKELHRVVKGGGRVILDIPNPDHKDVLTMIQAETYLGRSNALISPNLFEKELKKYFKIIKIFDEFVMRKYFLSTI